VISYSMMTSLPLRNAVALKARRWQAGISGY
jgi:hypothetical protein